MSLGLKTTAMDPTTLVTFLYRAPPRVRTVELLGSWDNFTQPYTMHHDRRRGQGTWSGCFKFRNIIFDGDGEQLCFSSKPRSGGLKQGGTYWYYYRLDWDVDAYDDLQEWTTGCPLLPGQPVNVMEVPMEIVPPPSRCRSACLELELVEGTLASLKSMPRYGLLDYEKQQQTLDPDAKFAMLEPPPVSKVHERCLSDLALNGRLESKPPSITGTPVSPGEPLDESADYCLMRSPKRVHPTHGRPQSSRGSCRSVPVRRHSAHSSIVDACVAETPHEEHPDPLRSFPMPGSTLAPPMQNDPYTRTLSPLDETDSCSSCTPYSLHSQPTTSYSSEEYWRGHDQQYDAPEHPSHPDDPVGEHSEDVCSPTFSAATVSSSSGEINTPFRLSAAYSRPEDAPIDDVSQRLEPLTISDETGSEGQDERTPNFSAYALPMHAMESVHSLGKVSTIRAQISPTEQFLPEIGSTRSMADDIFSELGYLGGSIS